MPWSVNDVFFGALSTTAIVPIPVNDVERGTSYCAVSRMKVRSRAGSDELYKTLSWVEEFRTGSGSDRVKRTGKLVSETSCFIRLLG